MKSIAAAWRWIGRFLDDALPMPPRQRAERDDDGLDHSKRRRLALRLHVLSKRGKGGTR